MSGCTSNIVYVDLDDTLADRKKAMQVAMEVNPDMRFPQAEYGFYSSLPLIEGARDAMDWLLRSEKFTPYILTAPSIMNPFSYTEKRVWVENVFGIQMVKRLIISPNKGMLIGQYLIDDKSTGHGQENFVGELLHLGSDAFPSWGRVIDFLKLRSK